MPFYGQILSILWIPCDLAVISFQLVDRKERHDSSGEGLTAESKGAHVLSVFIGQNLTTWPDLTVRESEKHPLA